MSTRIIKGCTWDDATGGLVLEFLTPAADIRTNGMVINHSLLIPPEDEYLDLLKRVEESLQEVLEEALKSFTAAQGVEMTEDDSPSPWDNPEER